MRLLTVDDDPVFMDILHQALRDLGETDLTSANSAAEAETRLDSARKGFDCIFLDVQMPGMSGIELCARLRQRPEYAETPVLMITSMAAKAYIDDAFVAGATDYITKPLDRLDLKARIGMVRRLLGERQGPHGETGQPGASERPRPAFEEPMFLPQLPAVIGYLAMQNYFRTLGRKQLMMTPVLACEITNARTLYTRMPQGEYVEMLGDVAQAIFDSLKRYQVMIAHGGAGVFFCAVNNVVTLDREQVEFDTNLGLSDFRELYAEDGLPVPQVRAGSIVRGSVFSFDWPTRVFAKALQALEEAPESGLPDIFGRTQIA